MKYEVKMPSLGADMEHGKLMEWKIHPGDQVKKGQTMATVETTKSTVEIESFRDGKVLELLGKIGDDIPVGQTIALFEVVGEEKTPAAPRLKISPIARRLAQENHLDLQGITGSGPDGQIELKDIEAAINKAAHSVSTVTPASAVNIREAIAKTMARSKKEVPHYYLKTRISLDSLMHWLDELNQRLPGNERLMMPVVLMKAVLLTLKQHPEMNGKFENGEFVANSAIHLGMAIALKSGGVLVPALLDAQAKNLGELNSAFQDLLIRTRKGELRNRELTEGTFTITNLGDLGSDEVFGIIFPPQVGLLGLGRIRQEPVVSGNIIRPGFVIDVTLSADHRVTDGLAGSRFLTDLEATLLNPSRLEEAHEHPGSQTRSVGDISRDRAGDQL